IKSELKLFHFFKLFTLTPYFAPMTDNESPAFTLYVCAELWEDELFELELEPVELDEFDDGFFTINLFPGKMSVVSKLFHFIKSLRDTLYFAAMPLNVSPLFTM